MDAKIAGVLSPAPKRTLKGLIEREQDRKRRRAWIAGGLVTAVVLLSVAAVVWIRPGPVPLSARFRSAAITQGDVVREVSATGHLEAVTTVQVGAEISGRIATVEVDHNDRVRAGQVLARFDRTALEAQLAQSTAVLWAARATLAQTKTERERTARDEERARALFGAGTMTEATRDQARSAARLAEQRVAAADAQVAAQLAAHQVARTNLEHTVIRAPIDGVVITRDIDPGQTVASTLQSPVLFMVAADLRKMHVVAAVDEADIGEVADEQQAVFTVHAYPTRTFPAAVSKVRSSPETIQDVVTYGVELVVDNQDLALKPGMTASVRIRTKSASNVLRAPAQALAFTPFGQTARPSPSLWVLEGETLRRVEVQTGISDGELTELLAGPLAVRQRVLIDLTPEGRKAYGLEH